MYLTKKELSRYTVMMTDTLKQHHSTKEYIFFLKLEEQLPEHYFYLAQMFLLYNYTLIPVEISELKDLMNSKEQFVMALSTNIEQRLKLLKVQKEYLNHAILRGVINFYDLTSFKKFQRDKIPILRKNYHYMLLPMALFDLVMIISESMEKELEAYKSWPGGRRPRLPKLIEGP